jgi:hypothetical protein
MIDKTQTFQIIGKLLKTSLQRGHECYLFCCFKKEKMKKVEEYYGEYFDKINFIIDSNRNHLINQLVKRKKEFDAVLGINFFNTGLSKIYQTEEKNNFGFEYCWNEIYNQQSNFQSNGILFCNSEYSMKIIKKLSNFKNLKSVGSSWFEYLQENKLKEKRKKIVFMAPHNSFYAKKKNLQNIALSIIHTLRYYCDKNQYELVLKSRKKYSHNYERQKLANFDKVVSDDYVNDHIDTYKDASLVLNFCSSAINELTFLEVPYIIIGPEIQQNLHTDMSCDSGIKEIHKKYYSGRIIDKIHCDYLELNDNLMKRSGSELLLRKINDILNSNKNWNLFQELNFGNNHKGSSEKIITLVEKNAGKSTI